MEDKIGVFICSGYGIAEALDIDALCKVATDEYKVSLCKTVDSCEGSGLESINEDIINEGLNKIVIAGISPRRYADDAFPRSVIVEKIAMREQVIWCQPAGEEDTQMLAEDYLRMYITKVQKMERLEPFQSEETIDRSILVVGGGITGLTAAMETAKAGYEVRLVENTEKLGGWLARQHKSVPTRPPYRELEDTGIDALIDEVEANPRIKVYKSAITGNITGAPGLFDVTLMSNGNGKPDGEIQSLTSFVLAP
jgi:quinone-modifying oxidoreductase subunit QmoB